MGSGVNSNRLTCINKIGESNNLIIRTHMH